MRRAFSLSAALALAIAAPTAAADYQFGARWIVLPDEPLFNHETAAFLWVPPNARTIRAVLLAPANIIERRVADDAEIRAQAARDGMAILFFQQGWVRGYGDSRALARYVQAMLDTLAARSGYESIRTAPWIPFGHSANSTFVQGIARLEPGRVLASVVVKGALPMVPASGQTSGVTGIPTLFVGGEFEEVMPPNKVRTAWWQVSIDRFRAVRAAVPQALYSGLEDKSHGHIDWLPDMQHYLATFLHKAIAARVAPDGHLRPVRFETGWLGDPDDKTPLAPVAEYRGDRARAFWFFDADQARQWQALNRRDRGKREQLLGFVEDGKIAPLWPGWGLQALKFLPQADGDTFSVHATFRDAVPPPFADAGTAVGHVEHPHIRYRVAGWASNAEQVGPDRFAVRFDREGFNGRTARILIGAVEPGDARYRETSAIALIDVPISISGGRRQAIRFDPLPDVRAGTPTITLHGSADSGLPVHYFVSWGPAEIDGDRLRFTALPQAARFPIEVAVTAYQWGRPAGDVVNSATPVTRVFRITR